MTIRIINLKHPTNPTALNPLSVPLRKALLQEWQTCISDPNTRAIILTSPTANFSAGADIREFQTPPDDDSPTITDIVRAIAASSVPVIAALRGVALGGGLELALACDIRVADATVTLGLPEVKIGLIPGAYGTQRLARCAGLDFALDVMTSGRNVGWEEALRVGLLNGVCEGRGESLEDCARRWASWAGLLGNNEGWKLEKRSLEDKAVLEKWRGSLEKRDKGGEAVQALLDAVEAGFDGYDAGCEKETELFWDLLLSSEQGRARRHLFFAQRKATQPKGAKVAKWDRRKAVVGVIGAGTMGSGIATSFLLAGVKQLILVDVSSESLARGIKLITKILQSNVKKGKMSKQRMAQLLSPPCFLTGDNINALRSCNLVVEAVFENMGLKQKIMKQLASVVSPETVLASNTSSLDITQIFRGVTNPCRCLGMHFFSPAHLMPLVEIVKAEQTGEEEAVAVIRSVTKALKKVGVVVGNCDGFVGNRMVFPYQWESVHLLTDGATVQFVDQVIRDFGMKIGPFQMADLAGNDVGHLIRKEKGFLRDEKTGLPGKNRPQRYTELADDLILKLKRTGQKSLKGWYNYDPNKGKGYLPLPSSEVTLLIASHQNNDTKTSLNAQQIIERVLYPLVNEGFKILEEGIASDPCHIDVIYIYGYGWPVWRGGPMYWADNDIGLDVLLSTLEKCYAMFPGSEYFKPSNLLRKCVALNVGVQEYYDKLHKGGDVLTRSKL